MKILVTGFEPFGGETMNPAWEAVKQLPSGVKGAQVEVLQIPTAFRASATIVYEAIEKGQPDVVLCVGQAGGRFGITPERVAINIDDARIADNCGQQPIDEAIHADGEAAYFSTLPVKAMVAAVKAKGLPSSLSNSAGSYVCNHIMYQVLYYAAKKAPSMKAGFVHVPYVPEQVVDKPGQPSMNVTDIVTGLTACLEAIVDYADRSDIKVIGGTEQ